MKGDIGAGRASSPDLRIMLLTLDAKRVDVELKEDSLGASAPGAE